MGITKGSLSVRRLRVVGEVPSGFRDPYTEALRRYAFQPPPVEAGSEEIEGWVEPSNLLDTAFDLPDSWLVGDYGLLSLRIDKKTLPAKLFAATLAKKCEVWCEERGLERCPASIKSQLKDELEDQWYKRALPRVQLIEAVWSLSRGYVLLHSHSERVLERFRKRFYATFGLELVLWSPLDWLGDAELVETVLAQAPARLLGGAEALGEQDLGGGDLDELLREEEP